MTATTQILRVFIGIFLISAITGQTLTANKASTGNGDTTFAYNNSLGFQFTTFELEGANLDAFDVRVGGSSVFSAPSVPDGKDTFFTVCPGFVGIGNEWAVEVEGSTSFTLTPWAPSLPAKVLGLDQSTTVQACQNAKVYFVYAATGLEGNITFHADTQDADDKFGQRGLVAVYKDVDISDRNCEFSGTRVDSDQVDDIRTTGISDTVTSAGTYVVVLNQGVGNDPSYTNYQIGVCQGEGCTLPEPSFSALSNPMCAGLEDTAAISATAPAAGLSGVISLIL